MNSKPRFCSGCGKTTLPSFHDCFLRWPLQAIPRAGVSPPNGLPQSLVGPRSRSSNGSRAFRTPSFQSVKLSTVLRELHPQAAEFFKDIGFLEFLGLPLGKSLTVTVFAHGQRANDAPKFPGMVHVCPCRPPRGRIDSRRPLRRTRM